MTISVNTLLASIRRSLAIPFQNADAIEWIAEGLAAIDAYPQYEEGVAFVEVSNHMAPVPERTVSIRQIARNHCWENEPVSCTAAAVIETAEPGACDGIPIDCCGLPLVEYDIAYFRPYFDLVYNHDLWGQNTLYNTCYRPVKQADSTMFSALINTTNYDEATKVYQSEIDEYKIAYPYIWFSFKEGFVAISYYRVKLDTDGSPVVPDDYSYQQALTAYVRLKLVQRKFDMGEQGAAQMLDKAEKDWHWYCKQVKNSHFIPRSIDDFQNRKEKTAHMIPKDFRYYGFFGSMATPELRNWNNRRETTFRGDI